MRKFREKVSPIPMGTIIGRFARRFKARAVHAAFVSGFWPAAGHAVVRDRSPSRNFFNYVAYGLTMIYFLDLTMFGRFFMKTFIFPFLACCFLAFNALASKGVEIRHKTQFCAAEVYFRYPDRNPPQEEIDKSNRERTTVTLREYITLTATLDGKNFPKAPGVTGPPWKEGNISSLIV